MTNAFYFNIEILGMGQCNLRCPSCPTGNYREVANPMGMMSPQLMDSNYDESQGRVSDARRRLV